MRRVILSLALLAALPAAGHAADMGSYPARPAPAAEASSLPACDAPGVLSEVVERQTWAETNTWRDGLRIAALQDVRQRYNTTRFASMIEHRHCEAEAVLETGRTSRVYYVISGGTGFAGLGYGVEVCLPRQDYYRVYDAACRVLR